MGEAILHQGVQSQSDPILTCLFLVFHLGVAQTVVDEDVGAKAKDSSRLRRIIVEVREFDAFQHLFTPRAFSFQQGLQLLESVARPNELDDVAKVGEHLLPERSHHCRHRPNGCGRPWPTV